MATKAAERAREWWYERTQSPKGGHVDNEIIHALAAYEAAIIERCAQIADKLKEETAEYARQLKLVQHFGAKGVEERSNAYGAVAAAIRSMGDAK